MWSRLGMLTPCCCGRRRRQAKGHRARCCCSAGAAGGPHAVERARAINGAARQPEHEQHPAPLHPCTAAFYKHHSAQPCWIAVGSILSGL